MNDFNIDLSQVPTLAGNQPAAWDAYEKSAEKLSWLRTMIALGFTSHRGPAWHAANQGEPLDEFSHFDGPVPAWRVAELLSAELIEGAVDVHLPDGSTIQDDRNKAIIVKLNDGTRTIVNYPRKTYALHPYMETLEGTLKALADDGIPISSVGLLKQGAVAFIQGILPTTYEVEGYGYTPYVGIATSADGSIATTPHTGIKGEVCDNTVRDGLRGAVTKTKIRHTSKSKPRVSKIREALGIKLARQAEDFDNAVRDLVKVDVTEQDFDLWLDEMAPVTDAKGEPKTGRSLTMAENKRGIYVQLSRDPKVAPWWGTLFGVAQLDNTFRQWFGQDQLSGGGRIEKNLLAATIGTSAKDDAHAIEVMTRVQERRMTFA